MVRRDLLCDSAARPRLGDDVGIGAAEEPEHRRCARRRAEQPEVLTTQHRVADRHPLWAQHAAQRVTHPLCGVRVVHGERETVDLLDVGVLCRAGRGRLRPHDPFDGAQYAFADRRIVGAHIQVEFGLGRDDVGLGARADRPDRQNDRVTPGDLP